MRAGTSICATRNLPRSAASALANQAKLLGTSLGPFAAGLMGLSAAPFVVAGVLKIAYDLSLYRLFRRRLPPEEHTGRRS